MKYMRTDPWSATRQHFSRDFPSRSPTPRELRLVYLGISTLEVKNMDEKLEGEAEGSQEEEEPNYGLVFKESFSFWKDQGPTEADGASQPKSPTMNLDFSKPWKRSDAILTVDNNVKFHIHTGTLSRQSPVFEQMLSPENLSKYPNREIYLVGKNADEFREFLKVLYSGEPVREYKINYLLPLAHEYQTPVVLRRCQESLIPKVTNETLAFKYISIAHMYGLEGLRRACVQLLKIKSYTQLKGSRMYREIPPQCGWDVTEGRVEILENELAKRKSKLEEVCDEMITRLFEELYRKQSGGRPPPMNAAMGNKICFIKEAGNKSDEMKIIAETIDKLERLYS